MGLRTVSGGAETPTWCCLADSLPTCFPWSVLSPYGFRLFTRVEARIVDWHRGDHSSKVMSPMGRALRYTERVLTSHKSPWSTVGAGVRLGFNNMLFLGAASIM